MEKPIILSSIQKDTLISEITSVILTGVEQLLKDQEKSALDSKEWLTAKEMQNLFKISSVTLWEWDRKGITQPHKIGRHKRYRKDVALAALKKIESNKRRAK